MKLISLNQYKKNVLKNKINVPNYYLGTEFGRSSLVFHCGTDNKLARNKRLAQFANSEHVKQYFFRAFHANRRLLKFDYMIGKSSCNVILYTW